MSTVCYSQEEDREARKQELIEDHEQSKSTKEEEDEEPDEEEEDEFREKLKEIEDEVYEEQEDPQVLEEEETAKERINGVLIEKAEEQTESVQSLKVHCIPMTSYFKGTDNGVDPIHRGINVPKRPFRITIIRYVELETFTAHGVLFVLLVIHGGEL